MALDDTRIIDTKRWLVKAFQDLRRVEILLAATPADVEGALFHTPSGSLTSTLRSA